MNDLFDSGLIGEVLPQFVRFAFAMPVRSTGDQQLVPAADGEQPFSLLRWIATVPYLQPIQSLADQCLDLVIGQQSAVTAHITGMGDQNHTARSLDGGHHFMRGRRRRGNIVFG